MELSEFKAKVQGWGSDRGIIQNSNKFTQLLKLMSEFGELCDNLAKGKNIEDDIGDMMVVLEMIGSIKYASHPEDENKFTIVASTMNNMLRLLTCIYSKDNTTASDVILPRLVRDLRVLAKTQNTTLEKCCEVAYNDIKDRTGFMNSNGVFIKSTDANYEELYSNFKKSEK